MRTGWSGRSSEEQCAKVAQYLGFEPGSLQGMNILELGPLEATHTYQLAKLGADRVLAIEAEYGSFLKCLVVVNYGQAGGFALFAVLVEKIGEQGWSGTSICRAL